MLLPAPLTKPMVSKLEPSRLRSISKPLLFVSLLVLQVRCAFWSINFALKLEKLTGNGPFAHELETLIPSTTRVAALDAEPCLKATRATFAKSGVVPPNAEQVAIVGSVAGMPELNTYKRTESSTAETVLKVYFATNK